MTRHGELNTTKNILLKTAVVMIKEDGMEGFSARKLASRCGLTHQVPYRYFRNKEDLMGSVIAEILTQMSIYISAMVKKRKDEEPFLVLCEESIRFLVDVYKRQYLDHLFVRRGNGANYKGCNHDAERDADTRPENFGLYERNVDCNRGIILFD